jgi:uncharacterized C2H2 Zn-finger protein
MSKITITEFKCPVCDSGFSKEADRDRSLSFFFADGTFGRSYYVAPIKVICPKCSSIFIYIYDNGAHTYYPLLF